MEFTESLIFEYARKIFGFAYSKTKNYHNAQDLSQDIICELCKIKITEENIDNLNAYIYRVCCNTWSNYLRKNHRQWAALNNAPALDLLESEEDFETDCIQKELMQKLRQEIMYLGKIRRDCIVQYYYENKSSEEIAKILSIPASTVRWYLYQTKLDLKERMELLEQLDFYKPVMLSSQRNGWGRFDPCGLGNDLLTQNILWVCHGKALSIEEIARTLGVAAVYLEDKIEQLLYFDYLKKTPAGKYQTAFFIPDENYQLADRKFHYEKTMPIALQLYNVVRKALPELKTACPQLSEFNENFLRWSMLTLVIMDTIHEADCLCIEQRNLQHGAPLHKNGNKYWATASIRMSDILENHRELSDDFTEFCTISYGNQLTMPKADNMTGLKFTIGFLDGVNNLGTKELTALRRVSQIIKNRETPNLFDQEAIDELKKKQLISENNGGLQILIPYFTAEQINKVKEILKKHADKEVNMQEILGIYNEYIDTMNKHIPKWVDSNERNHLLTSYGPPITIYYLLMKNGYLQTPSEDEKKRLCTLVWEES